MPLGTQLFSTTYVHSFVNNLAFAMPATAGSAVGDTASYLGSLVQNPFRSLAALPSLFGMITPAQAAAANDPNSPQNNYGLTDYGYTPAQLQLDDTTALNEAWANAQTRLGRTPTYGDLELDDCPNVADPAHDPNLCRLDIAAIQAAGAKYTQGTDGGLGD
jgi:hypothetical protein